MIIAPFLCDLRIDEDGGMKIQMMSFPCRGIPRQGKEVMNHQIISHQRLCNPHCLRLYLMVLGLLALWKGRSEVVLGCLGALLTLSGYGDTERDMTGSGNKNSNSPSLPAGGC